MYIFCLSVVFVIWYTLAMNMFKSTTALTPDEYVESLPESRRQDFETIHELIKKALPSFEPHILSGMIGYGTYHYRYASGKEGDWSLICLANQKNYISVYVCAIEDGEYIAEKYKGRLPKVSIGKSCIRFKGVSDVDLDVLTEIIKRAEKVGGAGQI